MSHSTSVVLFAIPVLGTSLPALAALPSVTPLGVLSAEGVTTPRGLSADGMIVAGDTTVNLLHRAFKHSNGSIAALNLVSAYASGVSGDGATIVGWSNTSPRMWVGANPAVDMGVDPTWSGAWAIAISTDSSAACGRGITAAGDRAAYWSGGVPLDLGILPGGTTSYAHAINANGSVVVGEADIASIGHPARWTISAGNASIQDLGLPAGMVSAVAAGVSASGAIVVGQATDANGFIHGFRWAAGSFQMIPPVNAGGDLHISGISGDGKVVVGYEVYGSTQYAPIAWTAQTGTIDLPAYLAAQGTDLTNWYALSIATGISADGSAIIGTGIIQSPTGGINRPGGFVIRGISLAPVMCPADLDNGSGTGTPDGGVDINDLLYFLVQFEAGTPSADLDNGSNLGIPDGGVDINDLLYFISHFETGW